MSSEPCTSFWPAGARPLQIFRAGSLIQERNRPDTLPSSGDQRGLGDRWGGGGSGADEEFFRQEEVSAGARALWAVLEDGLPVGRGFGQAGIGPDLHREHTRTVFFPHVGDQIAHTFDAVVDRGEHDAKTAGPVAGAQLESFGGLCQVVETFERQVLRHRRDEEGVGGEKGVLGQKAQGRRAIEEDLVEGRTDTFELALELPFFVAQPIEFDFGAAQVDRRRQYPQVLLLGTADRRARRYPAQ